MYELIKQRAIELQKRIFERTGLDGVLLTDEDSIAYIAGYWGYLGVEFGRPTMVWVPKEGECAVITPLMESEMGAEMTWINNVHPWEDGKNGEWRKVLEDILGARTKKIGIEKLKVQPLVGSYLQEGLKGVELVDCTSLLGEMRVIKSVDEIDIMRQAGQVAIGMVEGGKAVLAEGVPEYEIALGVIAGGTRKAAGFLTDKGFDQFVSPTIHNLQVFQSGCDTSKVHRRSNVRKLQKGDPVYMCFCGMVNFKQYKLGFDREFFIGSVTDEQARIYEVAIAAQKAALETIRPGVVAEEVHFAANEVYQSAGFEPGYRTGRSIGVSFLEMPEFKGGDKTIIKEGMTFAVDGGITIPNKFGARVGDSIVVTKNGFEYLTPYSKELTIIK